MIFFTLTHNVCFIMYENYEKSHFHNNDTFIQVPTDSTSLGCLGKGHALTETNIL